MINTAGTDHELRLLAVVRGLLVAMAALVGTALHAQPATPAPDFALKTVNGENIRLSEHRGRVVLVAFWTSWCSRCPQLLNNLQSVHADLGARGLQVMAVGVGYDDARSARAAAGRRISYPILLDVKRDVAKTYQVETMPTVVLVDRDGGIAATAAGSEALKKDYRACDCGAAALTQSSVVRF